MMEEKSSRKRFIERQLWIINEIEELYQSGVDKMHIPELIKEDHMGRPVDLKAKNVERIVSRLIRRKEAVLINQRKRERQEAQHVKDSAKLQAVLSRNLKALGKPQPAEKKKREKNNNPKFKILFEEMYNLIVEGKELDEIHGIINKIYPGIDEKFLNNAFDKAFARFIKVTSKNK